MSSQTTVAVPPGQSPPFAVVTPDDHEASILISTAFGLACFLFFAGIRTVIRTTISHGIGLDDYLFYAATVLAIIQSCLILGACSKGLGKALHLVSLEEQHEIQKMVYTGNLFFIVVTGLSKISVVSFLHRISLIGALDIVTEIAIVALVGYMVRNLQTSAASKLTVLSIFSVRLLLIIFIALRLHTFDQSGYTTNPLIRETNFIAWTQSEMTYSLISATVPIFHNFLKSLSTGFGGLGVSNAYGYGSGCHSLQHGRNTTGYQLSKLRSKNKSAAMPSTNDDQEESFGHAKALTAQQLAGTPAASTTVQWSGNTRSNGETTSINSNESQRYMIRKDVQWEVRTEPRE
ncbi:hypothetical protein H2200_003699 [Cladophialophora chaetospira]|uniref:Rhodopsin domain-containing protein n=1 Tax=Cladophialophora chaetospira TaxID=386627 RepID=A0AA38XEW5_9EURO|nr:hypothetical protein H2200_003699 [Cladophialophora chaetospira]